MGHHIVAVFGVLAQTLVELAAHSPGDVGYYSVEGFPARFVSVEVVVDVGSKIPSGLGDSIRIGVPNVFDWSRRLIRAVFEPRYRVPQRREAQAQNGRPVGGICDLIQPALLEPLLRAYVVRVCDVIAVVIYSAKPPVVSRNAVRLGVGHIANFENCPCFHHVGGRIRLMALVRQKKVVRVCL